MPIAAHPRICALCVYVYANIWRRSPYGVRVCVIACEWSLVLIYDACLCVRVKGYFGFGNEFLVIGVCAVLHALMLEIRKAIDIKPKASRVGHL